jgi:hypothetical protein
MPTDQKMPEADYIAIVAFLQPQLQAIEVHIEKLRPLVKDDTNGIMAAQFQYHLNYASTCRHLLALAKQKAGVKTNVFTRNTGHTE